MKHLSLRAFVGSKDYDLSRQFYKALGFQESVISEKMCYCSTEGLGFYLQDYYVKAWVNNTMMFMQVENVEAYWEELKSLNLVDRFAGVRLVGIQEDSWGKEFFVYDPSGVLWHFGQFKDQA